jgi:predicted phosphodiesterase
MEAPDEDQLGDSSPTLRFRAIFISDIHLGTASCQAEKLLDFLRHTDSRELYLVGDVIDGWQLKRRWYWHQSHNDVIQKVLRKARKGTRVTYIAGNHDEAMRHFLGLAFGGIDIRDESVHVTADGRRLLVTHGDLFDAVVQRAKWLAHLGDAAYLLTLKLSVRPHPQGGNPRLGRSFVLQRRRLGREPHRAGGAGQRRAEDHRLEIHRGAAARRDDV